MTEFEKLTQGYWLQLVSTSDSKHLLAEVYYQRFLICVIDRENGPFEIGFTAHPGSNYGQEDISASLDDFLAILQDAKEALQG
jgi:hypothetical protein